MSIASIQIEKETWFKISDLENIRPFFMNIVSDSNHWMFISSNGGLTAGRKNNQFALFPYYTDDKLTELADTTGSKTIFQVKTPKGVEIWEPFSKCYANKYKTIRNIYKNFYGNKVMFEETNHDLGLTFRYQWNSSNLFGFVRTSEIVNHSGNELEITLLDGIQNVMPYGIDPDLQASSSNLADAYKRSELLPQTGLGIFALSAIIVDKAEPSEALKANVAWSYGLDNPQYLVSSLQVDVFRNQGQLLPETDIKGEKGAYILTATLTLQPDSNRSWKLVANVNQNQSQVVALNKAIREDRDLAKKVEADVEKGTKTLHLLVASADGVRTSADPLKDARHYSNVLFNIMRGGIFDNNYQIEKNDFCAYIEKASKTTYCRNAAVFNELPVVFDKFQLDEVLGNCADTDLYRLSKEYLPLKFSRRHGDPSRPWNKFSINTHSELDGSKILDYEGNWRDIFQNWEALVHSYPEFIEGMIFKFLNNSTFDGYNPYRVTKGGFDWETIEPDNPWSYIGYWGDHQIIYLLKFLEFYNMHQSDALQKLIDSDYFVYANVPYRIKPYADIAKDPKNTISFDAELDESIREKVGHIGADGALLNNNASHIHHVNFLEKILATVLAKMSNFIPEAGIWLNTQRPEWNDANNALVGNGVSMVTLYYLRRFLKFFEEILADANVREVQVSNELVTLFTQISEILIQHESLLKTSISDENRKRITDRLGEANSTFRLHIYEKGFSGEKSKLAIEHVSAFVQTSLQYLEHSIDANRRTDNLYHSYNIMSMHENGIKVSYLSEMLEGQVAVLSSGYLSAHASADLLDALRKSKLYRADQNSYILYPNRDLPKFLEKNCISEASVGKSVLLQKLVKDGNLRLISRDVEGGYHFNGNFRNASDLREALSNLKATEYNDLVEKESDLILQIFEEVFNHKAFTGRSGTFFAYEGLGSIYWHMVSKLHLAVQEVNVLAQADEVDKSLIGRLHAHFCEIGEGIGIHKTPELYGAFPTDPYSHTPQHRGAQQPGMTGQVKEDILVSIGELGIFVKEGMLHFKPILLKKAEFSQDTRTFDFVNISQKTENIEIPSNALCFSYCQVPVIYQIGTKDSILVAFTANESKEFDGLQMDKDTSEMVFHRTGEISKITVSLRDSHLIST